MLREASDVLPQGLPLVFLIPDVRSLEEWDNKVLRQVEDLERRPNGCIHSTDHALAPPLPLTDILRLQARPWCLLHRQGPGLWSR